MTKQEPQGYPERWVWAACAHIYGQAIAPRTWRKYKSICRVPSFRGVYQNDPDRTISKTHCQWLMMLAYMRSEQRGENRTRPSGCNTEITIQDIVKRLNSNPSLKQTLDKALGDAIVIEGVKGAEVPNWLQRQIGKSPSIATLRRWAKKHGLKFSTHEPVPVETLDRFLKIA